MKKIWKIIIEGLNWKKNLYERNKNEIRHQKNED
jgi:hypothetical protein